MNRRTKIVATIGPASEDEATLRAMIRAGMDVARLGLAHNTIDEGLERFHRIRKVSEEEGHRVGILVDLPGPKVRAGNFGDTGVDVPSGSSIELRVGEAGSSADVIEVDYEFLMRDIQVGDRVTIGDGGAVLEVTDKKADKMLANVVAGSTLRGRPGVHIPSDRLQIPTPTPEDFLALDAFVDAGVDMIAVSFVRSAHDMRRVGTEPHPRGPCSSPKSRPAPPSTTSPASSRRPVPSWSLAAISATSAASRICHTCKRTSSASASPAAAR